MKRVDAKEKGGVEQSEDKQGAPAAAGGPWFSAMLR